MATEVFSTEEITLLDGKEIELRPLAVAKLRRVMRLWSEHLTTMQEKFDAAKGDEELLKQMNNADLSDAQFDVFIKMCGIALETQLKGEKSAKAYSDYLEDTLDEASIYKILEVCANLKLGNQNPAES